MIPTGTQQYVCIALCYCIAIHLFLARTPSSSTDGRPNTNAVAGITEVPTRGVLLPPGITTLNGGREVAAAG